MTDARALDRRLQFSRASLADDGFEQAETWADHGAPVWASRQDVRDSEKIADGQTIATLMSRFVVRSSELTRGVGPKDRFVCDGRTWEVLGTKQGPGRSQWVEITAASRSD